jgi:hypothetical protein
MSFLKNIPLFALLLLIYNAAAFGDYYQPQFTLETLAIKFPMNSGMDFSINIGEMLLVTGVALLYLELLKSTRTTKPYLIEHMLSMVVFVIFIVEFFLVPQAQTFTFFLLMIMSFLDVIGGFSVTLNRHVVLPGTVAGLAVAATYAPVPTPNETYSTQDEKIPEEPKEEEIDPEEQKAIEVEEEQPDLSHLRGKEKIEIQ